MPVPRAGVSRAAGPNPGSRSCPVTQAGLQRQAAPAWPVADASPGWHRRRVCPAAGTRREVASARSARTRARSAGRPRSRRGVRWTFDPPGIARSHGTARKSRGGCYVRCRTRARRSCRGLPSWPGAHGALCAYLADLRAFRRTARRNASARGRWPSAQMPDARQKVVARPPLVAGGPPDEVRAGAEQDEDLLGSRRRRPGSAFRTKAARRGRIKGRRRSDQALGASSPDPASLAPALRTSRCRP